MGNCAPPEDRRSRCPCAPEDRPEVKLVYQEDALGRLNGLGRANSGEIGEEQTKQAIGSDPIKRQISGNSAEGFSDHGFAPQSSNDTIGTRTSVKPAMPLSSKRSTPGFYRLASLSNLFESERSAVVGATDSKSISDGRDYTGDYHSGGLLHQSRSLRDFDEEFHERKAELAQHYPEGEPCSPHGQPGKIGGRGIVKGSRQVESVMRRLVHLGKSKSSNNLPGDEPPTTPKNESKKGVRVSNEEEVQEYDGNGHLQFSDPAPPELAKEATQGEVAEEDIGHASRNFKNSKMLRRSRSLLADIGSRRPSMALQLIIENPRDIDLIYTFDRRELGAGSFGSVRRATVKSTGAVRAVKSISKDRMQDTMGLLKMEIRITKMVDHPHIIKLYELFEDALNVHLVMELCSGGQLHDFVTKRGHLSEPQVCRCMQQILRAVVYLHNHHICHRDLKPENVLLSSEEPIMHNSLKLTDFGVSCLFKPKQVLNARVGTSAYMAPEVIKKSYRELCDLWSVGVTMYFLFCGSLPFFGKNIEEIRQRVCSGIFEFTREFVDVSEEGIDMMQKLMLVSPNTRPTAKQALHHKWFAKYAPKPKLNVIPSTVFDALRIFRAQNKFKKAALCLIASLLSKEQLIAAHDAFCALDTDGDGIVSVAEIRDRLRKDSQQTLIPGVDRILRDMDRACKNHFDDCTYTEFLAANLDRERYIKEAVCRAAFSVFDQDCDGFITKTELTAGEMFGKMTEPEVATLVADLATKGHEHVEFEDFMKMMQEVPEVPKSALRETAGASSPSKGSTQKTKSPRSAKTR
mmetsp:Transcript_27208/g.51296  ORF Transcript_27208/g.51296 Transcript_27208/m.51296 type:complete len:801 (+) Transcript_27208:119-2521(+)